MSLSFTAHFIPSDSASECISLTPCTHFDAAWPQYAGTIPWGILSTHLHDYLAHEARLTMTEATGLVAQFGMGAASGGIIGGYLGVVIVS